MAVLLYSTSIFHVIIFSNYVFICGTWTQVDFKPVLRELLATHPGLEFLQSTPEFQERYGMFANQFMYCQAGAIYIYIYTLILFLFFSCIFDLFLSFSCIFDLFYIVHIPKSVFWFHC